MKQPFAEVVESSLPEFIAQSWQWNKVPHFGSLISVTEKNRTIFGIVHQIKTGSMDPMRYPFPYQKTHEQLLKEQPQIFEFLKTTFSCVVIGYKEKSKLFYTLAPQPCSIHSFTAQTSSDLTKQFLYNDHYLHILFSLSSHITNLDELLLAILKHKIELNALSPDRIGRYIKTFSLLTGNDYRRLKLFLQRVEQIQPSKIT